MRTILAALALICVHALPLVSQTLPIGNAQYTIGASMEETVKLAKLWDHRLELDEPNTYALYIGADYAGTLEFSKGKLNTISKMVAYTPRFIKAHQELAAIRDGYEQGKQGAAKIVIGDGGVMEENNQYYPYTDITLTWKNAEVVLQVHERNGATTFVVYHSVFARK